MRQGELVTPSVLPQGSNPDPSMREPALSVAARKIKPFSKKKTQTP